MAAVNLRVTCASCSLPHMTIEAARLIFQCLILRSYSRIHFGALLKGNGEAVIRRSPAACVHLESLAVSYSL